MIEIPLDEDGLQRILDALDTRIDFNDDETLRLVGGDFTLTTLLDFYSGYDSSKLSFDGYAGDTPVYSYPDTLYSTHDLIRILVEEIRRLRNG